MNAPLIAVIDETGTTNRPHLSTKSDFGVGAIVFDSAHTKYLAEAAHRIAREVSESDFKYKHVQKSTSARKIFFEAINRLSVPSGVFGFYTAGMSLLREKERAIAEMELLGSDDGGETAETAQRIRTGDSNAHFEDFLGYLTSCLITYAGSRGTKMNVHWDRRTDLRYIQSYCDSRNALFRSHPTMGDASEVRFV